jgi:hypothetical protein
MRSLRSFVATASVGLVLVPVIQAGAVPWLSCLGCETSQVMVGSYQSVAHAYQTARTWSSIARFWVAPPASDAAR